MFGNFATIFHARMQFNSVGCTGAGAAIERIRNRNTTGRGGAAAQVNPGSARAEEGAEGPRGNGMTHAGRGSTSGRGGKGGRGVVVPMLPSPPVLPRAALLSDKQDKLKRMLENHEIRAESDVPEHLRSGNEVHGMMSKLARIVDEQG